MESREEVLAALRSHDDALEYAADKWKADKEIVMAAVRQNWRALEHASGELRADREVVRAAVQQVGLALQYASEELKEDREIVLVAVRQDGHALKYASAELKSDIEIVTAAVWQDGRVLEYASWELKAEKMVVLTAMLQHGEALMYASGELKADREFMLDAVQQDGRALKYALRELKAHREFMLAAVQQNGEALEHASGELKADREFVLAAVQQNGEALKHVSPKYAIDVEFLCTATKHFKMDPSLLENWIDNKDRAEQLKKMLRIDQSIADLPVDKDGRRAIDAAHPDCKRAMEKALRLFGTFDVDEGHLHFSRTACVLSATSHAESSHVEGAGETTRVALKGMRDLDPVLAELRGRNGLDPERVVAVLAVYVDSSVADADKVEIKKAIPEYECENKHRPMVKVDYVEAQVEQALSGDEITTGARVSRGRRAIPEYECENKHRPLVKVRCVEDKVEQLLRPLLAKRIESASSSGGDSSEGTSDTEAQSSPGSGYRFMLVLELGDRALSTALMHDRITGADLDLCTARKIGSDVAKSINHLHKKKRIHSDLKPPNIVRIGLTWRPIDLDVSCTIGDSFGNKAPSSGPCPPEMAELLLEAMDKETNIIDTGKLASYKARFAYDLWSLGVLIFHLLTGRSLWNCDGDDNIELPDLRILAQAAKDTDGWEVTLKERLFRYMKEDASGEKKAAAHLTCKLLDPDPISRKKKFPSEYPMEAVLEEPFFKGKGVDDATLQEIAQDAKMAAHYSEATAKNTFKLIKMSNKRRNEMVTMCRVLLKGMFEANEVQTPSTIVVLEKPIPSEEEEEKMILLSLNEDGSGFELKGEVAKHAEVANKQFKQVKKWLRLTKTFLESVSDADPSPEKVFGSLKEMFNRLVTAKTLYLYLVDELTGKPVRDKPKDQGGIYPIEITEPSDIVPQLLPLLQVGMRAMSLYNGVTGIARMFGAPVPSLPASWREEAQESVELLKQKSSVEKFGVVHDEVISESPEKGTGSVRGESYRELKNFFDKHSKKDGSLYFAGLCRIGAEDGTAVWTLLTGKQEVKEALMKREEERLAEEGAHEAYLNNLLRERAQPATSHEATKADNGKDDNAGAAQCVGAEKHTMTKPDTLDSLKAEANTGNTNIILEIAKGWGFEGVRKSVKKDVPDVYCKVKYGLSEWETHHVQDSCSPVWSAQKVFEYSPNQDIEIDVFDKNRNGPHDYYGRIRSAVSDILNATNGSLDLQVKEQESPHGLLNRWSAGMFITVKCHQL